MITILYNRRRQISLALLFTFCLQFAQLPLTYALTSGPSQPEVQGFQPAGTSEMVDLFTGDFSYNIPLFELPGPNGGYPFNLSYQSGITMDQEASWVGLGWSLNPGAINRQMRGVPDEFNGDSILTKSSVAPNITVGLGAGVGVEIFGGAGGLSGGLSVRYNNYKGLGYNIDASIGYGSTTKSGMTSGVGLNVSLDSQEGVGVSPSLSLGNKTGEVGLGVGYNSKSGLSNVSITSERTVKPNLHLIAFRNKKGENTAITSKISGGATLSLASPSYTPQITMPMSNFGFTATLKLGFGAQGVHPHGYVKGFYNEQKLQNDKKVVTTHVYGYMNYQNSTKSTDILDFNREKDGMVTKESPNLAIPSLTYDIYSVSGQGIGAMYRPMRNDIGVVHDNEVTSGSTDVGVGVDIGPPLHVGGNFSVNHAKSTSGPWTDGSNQPNAFMNKTADNEYEPWYFKVHGEPSTDVSTLYSQIGGDNAVRTRIDGPNNNPIASGMLEKKSWSNAAPVSSLVNQQRKLRSQVIQPITNAQLMNGTEMVSLFKVWYFDNTNELQPYNHSVNPKHHIAGLTALTPEGLRYVYGIPAYNTYQEETSFTAQKPINSQTNRVETGNEGQSEPFFEHPETDKFLKISKMPPYAHSYLLTSIVGPDYVDVTDDGVTPDDLGYWVKFTYKKMNSAADPYQWRDPFSNAHYQEGWKTDPRDDKGVYTFGKKELWYLAQAETRSHIAMFTMSQREDGYGVDQKLQKIDNKGRPVYRLDKIDLFTRSARNNYKIKSVRFDYDYSLCPGVFNSITNKGKLTLKRVWFEYGSSLKGQLNPYKFSYHPKNPNYNLYAYDRWGSYKPYPDSDPLQNIDGPYSLQDPSQKDSIDSNAAAWSLTEIQLPSGGKVMVNYETDDYAYVQQQQAAQMMELVDPYTDPTMHPLNDTYILDDTNLKVRFRLEKPIPVSSSVNQKNEVLKYLDVQRKQLYFKMKVNLRSPGEGFYEYISGYADINFSGAMALEKDASNNNFAYGYFYVSAENKHHPFSVRAWQHLRTNQPELANSGSKLKPATSNGDRINQIKSLANVITQVKQMFQGFNNYCLKKVWGRQVIASKSWIRLNSPDKIKYGGGLRVRQVTIRDQWANDEEGIYGQLYEYTSKEGADTISSGVAAYEPLVGGEENPLRYAKKFTQSVPLRSDNNLFFEYPINETYYPGPQVGYGTVTVTSLAAASLAGKSIANIKLSDNKALFPTGANASYGTTGMTVHEFFTAKDFPVVTDETDKQNKPYNLMVTIPLLGSITTSKLTASQGYSVVTNDMHGKQKKVSNYRQDRTGQIEPQPISWVKYNYRTENSVTSQGRASVVSNVFKDNGDGTLSIPSSLELNNSSIPKYFVGQETEFFNDKRQFEDNAWGGGANVNVDGIFILFGVIPIPTSWPNVSKSFTQLRTAVTNKVVFKSGVLESTEAFDEGSHVVTKNLKWDKQTGAPVLTQVTNDFDAPIYDFSIPAYTQYQGMGAAYRNAGLSFTLSNVSKSGSPNEYQFTSSLADGLLCPGDEMLLYSNTKLLNPIAKAVYTGNETGPKIIFSSSTLSASTYTALITRSGYRNQLSVMAGSIKALQDPSIPGAPVTYTKAVTVVDTNPK